MKALRLAALAALVAAGLAPGAALAARTDITIGMVLEPPGLDPTSGNAAATDEVTYANIFEGLTRIDETGAVQPDLAQSWDISADGLTYTFHLHDGVKFHDGTPLTADVVKFSLDRTTAPGSTNGQKQLFAAIDTVEAVDPLTVKVTLKHPEGNFLYNLGWGDAEIVAPNSAATTPPIRSAPGRSSSSTGSRATMSISQRTRTTGGRRPGSTRRPSSSSPTRRRPSPR